MTHTDCSRGVAAAIAGGTGIIIYDDTINSNNDIIATLGDGALLEGIGGFDRDK
jgi:hypothetical protein